MNQMTEAQLDQELRARLDQHHLEIFHRTQDETMKRWDYEQEVKRPYYHVTELDDSQLVNWRKYLDFEESKGQYNRIKFLYERCLVTAANYDEFWFRYARWMLAQGPSKQEEVRNIYQRASSVFVPIARPSIRLYYAQFEESRGYPSTANDVYEAILSILPNHLETIVSFANFHRRQYGVQAAIETLKKHIDSPQTSTSICGALVSEWSRLVWEISGQADEARAIYQANKQAYLDCKPFWLNWLSFEVKQPASGQKQQLEHYQHVKAVYDAICSTTTLSGRTVQDVTSFYLVYLKEHGGPEAMQEFMRRDCEVNGPLSAQKGLQDRFAAPAGEDDGAMVGYPGTDLHESIFAGGKGGVTMYKQAADGVGQGGANGLANTGMSTY